MTQDLTAGITATGNSGKNASASALVHDITTNFQVTGTAFMCSQATWDYNNPIYPTEIKSIMQDHLRVRWQAGTSDELKNFLSYLSESGALTASGQILDILYLLVDMTRAKGKHDVMYAILRFCTSGHLTMAKLLSFVPFKTMLDSLNWSWSDSNEPTSRPATQAELDRFDQLLKQAASNSQTSQKPDSPVETPAETPHPPTPSTQMEGFNEEVQFEQDGIIYTSGVQAGAFSSVASFMASTDFKNAMRLVSVVILCSRVNDIYGFLDPSVWATMDPTFMDLKISSGMGFVGSGLRLLEWLRDKALVGYHSGFMKMFDFTQHSLKKWIDNVEDVIDNPGDGIGAQMARLHRVQSLLGTGKKLLDILCEKDIGSPSHKTITSYITRLKRLETDLGLSVGGQRPAPVAFLIHGASGQGKTSVVSLIKTTIATKYGLDPAVGTWSPAPGSSYDEGMVLKPYHYNLNDVAFRQPKTQNNGDPDLDKFFAWVNNDPLLSTQADLDSKGVITHSPLLVTLSTNNRTLNAQRFFTVPEALMRRFVAEIQVTVKDQFKQVGPGGETSNLLDPTKLDGSLDYWNFHVQKSRLEPPTTAASAKCALVYDTIYQGGCVKQFLRAIEDLTERHFVGQRAYLHSSEIIADGQRCGCCGSMVKPINMCTCPSTDVQSGKYSGATTVLSCAIVGGSILAAAYMINRGANRMENRIGETFDRANRNLRDVSSQLLGAIGVRPDPFRLEDAEIDHPSDNVHPAPAVIGPSLMSLLPGIIIVLRRKMHAFVEKYNTAIVAIGSVIAFGAGYLILQKLAAGSSHDQADYVTETSSDFWAKREEPKNIKLTSQVKSINPDHLAAKIDNNVVSLAFEQPDPDKLGNILTTFASGFFVRGSTIITTSHGFPESGRYTVWTNDGDNYTGAINFQDFTRFPDTDTVLWTLPVAPRRSLIDYFQKEGSGDRVSKVSLYLPRRSIRNKVIEEDRIADKEGNLTGPQNYGDAVHAAHRRAGCTYPSWVFDATGARTQPGDCGSPLVATIGQYSAIIGMHFALTRRYSPLLSCRAESHRLTREAVVRYLDRHVDRNAFLIPEIQPTDDTEEVVYQAAAGKVVFRDPDFSEGDFIIPEPSVDLIGGLARKPQLIEISPKCPLHSDWEPLRLEQPDDPILGQIKAPIRVLGSLDTGGFTFKSSVRYTPFHEQALADGIESTKVPVYIKKTWMTKSRYLKSINSLDSFPASEVQQVKQAFLIHTLKFLPPGELDMIKPMTLDEAINGIDNVKFLDAINMKTSMGFPDCAIKARFFEFVFRPDGSKRYLPPIEVVDEINRIRACYLRGETARPVFKAAFKDEPIKQSKLDEHRQRIIYGSPVAFTILMRQIYAPIFKLFHENKAVFGSCPGTNSSSPEWQDMREFLEKWSDLMNDGDFQGFDVSLKGDLIKEAKSFNIALMELTGNYTPDDIKVAWGIAYDVSYAVTDFFGDLLQIAINPSGQVGTSDDNGISQRMAFGLAFKAVTGLGYDQFFLRVGMFTYGDDGIWSCDGDIPEFTIQRIGDYLKSYGMIYTNAKKTLEEVPPRRFDDPVDPPSFLKRVWVYNSELGRDAAAIDTQTLDNMFHTYMASKSVDFETQFRSASESMLFMAAEHGPTVFELYRDRLTKYVPLLAPTLPTYAGVISGMLESGKEYMNSHRRKNFLYTTAAITRARLKAGYGA